MAEQQRPIFSDVREVNRDTSGGSWFLILESGQRLVFPLSVTHGNFEVGDTILMGFKNWDKPDGFAHFCHYRNRRPVQDFSVGPSACRVDPPNMETVYDGDNIKVVRDTNADSDLLCVTHTTGSVGIQLFLDQRIPDCINAASYGLAEIVIGADNGKPVARFKKEIC